MSGPESDPALLFTPTASSESLPLAESKTPPHTKSRKSVFYVEPPNVTDSVKKTYQFLDFEGWTPDILRETRQLDQIVGEYKDEREGLSYFGNWKGGCCYRFSASTIEKQRSDLLKIYRKAKEKGKFSDFDPSGPNIHPPSRLRMSLRVNMKQHTIVAKSFYGPASKTPKIALGKSDNEGGLSDPNDEADYQTEDSNEEGDDGDESESGEEYGRKGKRKPVKVLPFSPRKTRSRKRGVATYVESDDEDDEATGPTRRSTRTRKTIKQFKDNDDDDFIDDGDDDGDLRVSIKAKKKRGQAVRRAAYGHIRDVDDLNYDSHSDQENAPLRAHRKVCEKCHELPAHKQMEKWKKSGKRPSKKKKDEFEESGDEQETIEKLGGWLRCLKCPVVAHWKCLASTQQAEILRTARDRDRAQWRSAQMEGQEPTSEEPEKRAKLDANQTSEFICTACMKGGICMGCMEVALEPDESLKKKVVPDPAVGEVPDVEMADATADPPVPPVPEPEERLSPREIVFRCFTCKRLAHYGCLPSPGSLPEDTAVALAEYYQTTTGWNCGDCNSFVDDLDKIIAWRPYPPNAVEPPRPKNQPLNYKNALPREYLVKWSDRSFRRVQWVPHMFLLARSGAKLKHFLLGGSKVELLHKVVEDLDAMEVDEQDNNETFEIGDTGATDQQLVVAEYSSFSPEVNAERKIPPGWKTVGRVLDILLWYNPNKQKTKGKKGSKRKIESEDDDGEEDAEAEAEWNAAFDLGQQPTAEKTETLGEFEHRTRRTLSMEDIGKVVWAFIKWDDLGYEEATWDSPPKPEESKYYSHFKLALQRFITSRTVTVPIRSGKAAADFDKRRPDEWLSKHALKPGEQPKLGQDSALKLMPFQVDGFNWLNDNWWNKQHCILADEMGLGKTVQIATFVGNIVKNFKAFPILVVVPNSTVTNCIRELEKWAPALRVVPYYGEARAREIIKKYELSHNHPERGTTGAKYHVLVTTYETLTGKDFATVFKTQPRWEVLIVDEGQRLKNDSSLLFKKLNELNTLHRIIMTGTPLNNNIRELFNLMNFLDPDEWHDLEAMEKEHEELTEELIKELHTRLKPYFLRRIKSEVLSLPPKNEVIVPVSMTPLQREVYKSILSSNVSLLRSLTQPVTSGTKANKVHSNYNNMIMQLRKCLQHPYLFSEEIEPKGLTPKETHDKLIDGSAKLRLLKMLLPKLKARGHRVLLFSQFVIALNVIEDFLIGEGFKYMRLDGDTKQIQRQKDMDEFNRPGSDVFIYLLTTRAGGVGINLWSADTVIIFDPDFNPHQDLQAIARSHRFGQKKTCLVFKLMVKDSAEERIIQTGKKKMILDHLIVQKMDDKDESSDVKSILTYGAAALFDENEAAKDILYTDQDLDKLIEKTETEKGDQEETKDNGMKFAFAKVWSAANDQLEEVHELDATEQEDSWAKTLQDLAASVSTKAKPAEATGRGVRRRAAAVVKQTQYLDDSPEKEKTKKGKKIESNSVISEDSAYGGDSIASSSDTSGGTEPEPEDIQDLYNPKDRKGKHSGKKAMLNTATPTLPPSSSPSQYRPKALDKPPGDDNCGLCGQDHGDAPCEMTESSENLAEYRLVLMNHADDEPYEERLAAVKAIDETLAARGDIDLILGQPLHLRRAKVNIAKRDKGAIEQDLSQQMESTFLSGSAGPSRSSAGDAMVVDARTAANAPSGSRSPYQMFIAGSSSKRATEVLMAEAQVSPSKKARVLDSVACVVCTRGRHLMKDCPVVAEGPKAITKEIGRLEQDPSMSAHVEILRKLLFKLKTDKGVGSVSVQI